MSANPPPPTRRLTRSRRYKMIAGVCGGLAEYFELDPTLVRVAYVLVSILSAAFPGLITYIVLMFVLPPPPEESPAPRPPAP
ncbi:MAG TPA: PspC domain-containing protein [Thermoanaerobaculia bacterium]|jgi:phage shock protein C